MLFYLYILFHSNNLTANCQFTWSSPQQTAGMEQPIKGGPFNSTRSLVACFVYLGPDLMLALVSIEDTVDVVVVVVVCRNFVVCSTS